MPGAKDIGDDETRLYSIKCRGAPDGGVNTSLDALENVWPQVFH